MILYSDIITSRLQYISDFIGKEITGAPIQLTTDIDFFKNYENPKINYSHQPIATDEFFLKPHSLLSGKTIAQQHIDCYVVNGVKFFFKTEGDWHFDIFAASFYLLSRYEEYLPHPKDAYGRYAHENALAFKENFLHEPLINTWMKVFSEKLKQKFPSFSFFTSSFSLQLTYDIDEAYSYKYKGRIRTAGGMAKHLLKGRGKLLKQRFDVLRKKTEDPYDSYDWMNTLHEEYHLQPKYFFHVGSRNGPFDKNILPSHPAMKRLIQQHAAKYEVGIHPSWRSGDDEHLLQEEIHTLETITGKKIRSSRQHYIRFSLPDTFRSLVRSGIRKDYSMGYGSINGFRASVATSFKWYDLEKEAVTDLELFPFCFMDANSFYEQEFSAEQAFDEMCQYRNSIRSVNGTMIMIWHNNFLGTEDRFRDWKKIYERFIRDSF